MWVYFHESIPKSKVISFQDVIEYRQVFLYMSVQSHTLEECECLSPHHCQDPKLLTFFLAFASLRYKLCLEFYISLIAFAVGKYFTNHWHCFHLWSSYTYPLVHYLLSSLRIEGSNFVISVGNIFCYSVTFTLLSIVSVAQEQMQF